MRKVNQLETAEFWIRVTGWSGVVVSAAAIMTKDTGLFLVSQIIASISAFLWGRWLQHKKVTIDLVISFVLTVVSAITKDPWWMYAAILARAIGYQLTFERVLAARTNK
jgi:hypothetical protein